jgi:ClpP class serine protease
LGQQPAASILKVLERKSINEIDDDTLIMADVAEKAIRQVKHTVLELLRERMDATQAEQVATTLSTGVFTHDYPITVDEARALGLTVSTEMPKAIYEIMALYPQTTQRRPSVEYIPAPRRAERSPRGANSL